MVFRKVVVLSVIFSMSILKSPIIDEGFCVRQLMQYCLHILISKNKDWRIQVDGISQQLKFTQS